MKIVAWNCNMAFRKKLPLILALQPDILVIPECEHPDKLEWQKHSQQPTGMLWFGENSSKGLGVFSFNGYTIKKKRNHHPGFRFIIPIAVKSPTLNFTLYAVWAHNPDDPDGQYVEQVWKAINFYNAHVRSSKTILAGDFNSNTIWDRKRRIGNHSHVVEHLQKKGVHSTYHHQHGHQQGKEIDPTYFLYRHKHRPYHMDYCFASNDFIERIQSVKIGTHEEWSSYSDHMPVEVLFDMGRNAI